MRHSGFHVGIRKKLMASPGQIWDCFAAPRGLAIWIDIPADVDAKVDNVFTLENGSTIEWVKLQPGELITFKYKLSEWKGFSKVHIRIIGKGEISVVHILQENIPDENTRKSITEKLENILVPEFIC